VGLCEHLPVLLYACRSVGPYARMCMSVALCICMSVHFYVCTSLCLYTCVCTSICHCMSLQLYIHLYTYTFLHLYVHRTEHVIFTYGISWCSNWRITGMLSPHSSKQAYSIMFQNMLNYQNTLLYQRDYLDSKVKTGTVLPTSVIRLAETVSLGLLFT
jgi:hypothetical protein